MKKFTIGTLCAAMFVATPAQAQSAFVMIIGEAPRPAEERAPTVQTAEDLIRDAVEEACPEPFIRDLKARTLYIECVETARVEAEAILASREIAQTVQVASR